jgi:hypothetical protein
MRGSANYRMSSSAHETQTDLTLLDKDGVPVTIPITNGLGWQTTDEASRISLLAGIFEGATLLVKELSDRGTSVDGPYILLSFALGELRYTELAKHVDIFYSDPANILIPVIEAYKYSIFWMRHAPESDLKRRLKELRRIYNR